MWSQRLRGDMPTPRRRNPLALVIRCLRHVRLGMRPIHCCQTCEQVLQSSCPTVLGKNRAANSFGGAQQRPRSTRRRGPQWAPHFLCLSSGQFLHLSCRCSRIAYVVTTTESAQEVGGSAQCSNVACTWNTRSRQKSRQLQSAGHQVVWRQRRPRDLVGPLPRLSI